MTTYLQKILNMIRNMNEEELRYINTRMMVQAALFMHQNNYPAAVRIEFVRAHIQDELIFRNVIEGM